MSRIVSIVFFALLVVPCISHAETIDVHIKGVDDGVKSRKQQDYKEAVLFAKREAIERAGVSIKAMTTVKDLVLNSDYIESKAEAILLPGYNILDMGYSADGTYQIVLIGKVKTVSEGLDSKELRYAKSLMDRGEKSKARKIITDIINNSKDDNAVAEAMYCQVLWKFKLGVDTLDKLNAYYPSSKYVNMLEELLVKRLGSETDRDGRFISFDKGIVLDTKTNLLWAEKDNGEAITIHEAKMYCKEYQGGGFSDWRMPSNQELRKLYDKQKENLHGKHVTKLINIRKDRL